MRRHAILLCLLLNLFFVMAEAKEKKTVCLNMIVKNETPVIRRCLKTVMPLIDYWVIVDTGSTDGTQDMIREFMKDIPGELHERPWVNFAHNRNEALKLAKDKADYLLFIDADEIFAYGDDFKLPDLDMDFYFMTTDYNKTYYARVQMVKSCLNWNWEGVVHEAIICHQAHLSGYIENIFNVVNTDGARSGDPLKFHKDAALLEAALKEDPSSTRNTFYLAQSYRDAGEYEKAMQNYLKRIKMGGWNEEIYFSLYQVALIKENLNYPENEVINAYELAYRYRPTRIEPLYHLANYYRKHGNHLAAYLTARKGLMIPPSKDLLLVEHWAQDYGLLMEMSIAAYWIEFYEEAKLASLKLLQNAILPPSFRTAVLQNLDFIDSKLAEAEILALVG